MRSNKKRFSWWILPLAVVAALGGSLFWFRSHPITVQAQASSSDLSKLTTAQVQLGTIVSSIGATGTVSSNQSGSLAWQTSGRVAQVLVKQGDQVQANQILAQIDPSSSTTLVTAQANLLAAQQNLANVQNVAVAQAQAQVAMAKAQIAVMTAQNTLTALNAPPSQASISEANYAYLNDQQKVSQLQDTYNYWVAYENVPHCTAQAPGTGPGGGFGGFGGGGGRSSGGALVLPKCITMSDTQIKMQQANALSALNARIQKMNNDKAILDHLLNFKPYASQIATAQNNLSIAQAQLASAQANWDAIKNGPDPSQVAAAQSKIDSIQATIDQQYIRAPFAGTVTDIAVKPGDLVNTGTIAFEIDNLSPLVVTLKVSEVDINNVKVGQTADLSFYAAPGQSYTGTVTAIDPNGTVTNGVSNFGVTLNMDNANSLIKPGMTAGATIAVDSAANVMVVPIQAVVSQGSTLVVYILNGSSLTPVIVTLGLSNNTQVAVNSTVLKPGDKIVTNPADIPAALAVPQPASGSVFDNLLKSLGVTTTG